MYKTKVVLGILAISIGLILCIWNSRGFGDDIVSPSPYSTKSDISVQAWYDETWQASGFYRLTEHSSTPSKIEYKYKEIADPITNTPSNPNRATFVQEGSAEPERTEFDAPGGHRHDYTDATSGASLPQDIVVTEWKVTGHVHFASEI